MKAFKIALIILFVFTLSGLLILKLQSFKLPDKKEINERVNYLERVIQAPLDSNSEIWKLGSINQEWMLFTYSFSTYAFTNIAIRENSFKERAIKNIRTCIKRMVDSKICTAYGIEKSIMETDSIPDYSILYLGHLNLMLGCYRLLSNDPLFNELNEIISKSLIRRYKILKFLNLESYPSRIWISDNTVALASLKLYSTNTRSNDNDIGAAWIKYVKENYLDKETGVLYSTINPDTGVAIEEPRGSMLAWSILFIYQYHPQFAINLYMNYKEHFSVNYFLFRLFKERSGSHETSLGDLDSGPVYHGYSIPANSFALGDAILAGDYKTANQLKRLIDMGTYTTHKDNELKYKLRFIDMNISPMAEAIILYSLTIVNWTDNKMGKGE